MTSRLTEGRMTWLILGFAAGIAISTIWPHEPVQASATDRASQFAIATAGAQAIDPIEGVFTLDFLTGDLKGAVLNRQIGKFTAFYYRNITKDFSTDPNAKPSYALVTGKAQMQARGGVTPATDVLYVADLNSGKVICYGFSWRETTALIPPQPIAVVDGYLFREPLEQE